MGGFMAIWALVAAAHAVHQAIGPAFLLFYGADDSHVAEGLEHFNTSPATATVSAWLDVGGAAVTVILCVLVLAGVWQGRLG